MLQEDGCGVAPQTNYSVSVSAECRQLLNDSALIYMGPQLSLGVAPALQAGGRRFDPDYLHQFFEAGQKCSREIEDFCLTSTEVGTCTLKTEQCIEM